MAEWLGRASQERKMYCHDLDFMGLNPIYVEFGVHTTSFVLGLKILIAIASVYLRADAHACSPQTPW